MSKLIGYNRLSLLIKLGLLLFNHHNLLLYALVILFFDLAAFFCYKACFVDFAQHFIFYLFEFAHPVPDHVGIIVKIFLLLNEHAVRIINGVCGCC